jgi:hypothetical protein
MQFVRHGPDIPERLLQAHEDGRVVFFCGAGIGAKRASGHVPIGARSIDLARQAGRV